MVELSGLSLKDKFNKNGDIEIQITGLRPGENYLKNYYYHKILVQQSIQKFSGLKSLSEYSKLEKEINSLKEIILENDLESIRKTQNVVIDYFPNSEIVDHTFMKMILNAVLFE